MTKKRQRWPERFLAVSLAVLLIVGMGTPAAVYAAASDPVLRFDLTTEDKTTDLVKGDQIRVQVRISRNDGLEEPWDLYTVMVDMDYDQNLFEVSQEETVGAKRPDGADWIGRWTCGTILNGKRVRVLYVNLTGLMSSPPRLDTVSGSLTASFVLTAKGDVKGAATKVTFQQTEVSDSVGNAGPGVVGSELELQFAAESDDSSSAEDGKPGDAGGTGGNSGTAGSTGGNGNSSAGGNGSANGNSSEADKGGESSGAPADGQENRGNTRFSELTDIDASHWAADSVAYLAERGVVSGNDRKEFQPEKAVDRAEFAQMIAAAFGYEPVDKEPRFGDVTEGDWYYKPVMALYQAGIVSGTGAGRFGASDPLSRQDMAVILSRVLADREISLPEARIYKEFSDEAQIAGYAGEALRQMYCAGLMSGTSDTTLAPAENSTRAQVAVVLTKILKEAGK